MKAIVDAILKAAKVDRKFRIILVIPAVLISKSFLYLL